MQTALITTTVHVPKVLALHRKHEAQVKFFVAADEKTPREAYEFCADIPNCEIYSPERQRDLGYSCSELIGWNCIQRRNIALLEAVKDGAEIIYMLDDDNTACIDGWSRDGYFDNFPLTRHGLKASSLKGWFDPGCLLVPQTKHRGFPISIKSEPIFEPIVDAKIGVAAGLCLGDPDIDAVTRIANAPIIYSVSEVGRAGVVVDPMRTRTVFNSQNTAFIRELAPAMFMMPGVGRYDDIYASLICQRVMRESDLFVHFGQPFVWQQRNNHYLLSDLRLEIKGMENIVDFERWLDSYIYMSDDKTNVQRTRRIYTGLIENSLIPVESVQAALAFLDDIEAIL